MKDGFDQLLDMYFEDMVPRPRPFAGMTQMPVPYAPWETPPPPERQPFDWGQFGLDVLTFSPLGYAMNNLPSLDELGEQAIWAANALSGFPTPERTELFERGLYELTDTSFEPYISREERAALPPGDPRSMASGEASSIAPGITDIFAVPAAKLTAKYAPRVADQSLRMATFGEMGLDDVLAGAPEFINRIEGTMGLPQTPFKKDIMIGERGIMPGTTEADDLALAKELWADYTAKHGKQTLDFGSTMSVDDDGGMVKRLKGDEARTARKHIFDATGWWLGRDAHWRREIDDPIVLSEMSGPLGEVADIGELSSRYDDIDDVLLDLDPRSREAYFEEPYGMGAGRIHIGLMRSDSPETVARHELQHKIQYEEGHAGGSDLADNTRKSLRQYNRSYGEVEARNAERRAGMTMDERRMLPPWMTEDIPEESQWFAMPYDPAYIDTPPVYSLDPEISSRMGLLDELKLENERMWAGTDKLDPDKIVSNDIRIEALEREINYLRGGGEPPRSRSVENPSVFVAGRELPMVQPKRAKNANEVVVELDMKKMDDSWAQSRSFYLDREGSNRIGRRYDDLKEKLEDLEDLDMPEVGFTDNDILAFTDGRHRAAVLRDMGADTLPVSMSPEDAQKAADLGMTARAPARPGQLALPNPEREKIANQLERQKRWEELGAAAKNAGVKRGKIKGGEEIVGPPAEGGKPLGKTPKTGGRYVGAGPDITSPQKMNAVVTEYMNKVKRALDAGIPPGYFYESGRRAMAGVTRDTEHHAKMAELMQPTSTQVGPFENLNYAIRAHDQFRMGANVYAGIYPNSLRGSIQAALYDRNPFMGYKVDRYGNLLGPGDPHAHPLSMMPPNDMWEGLGTGLGAKKPPSGATQVAFSDEIRERAMNRLNKELIAEGKDPLTREEMQELHWLVIRAENEGRPLAVGAKDTIQGSIPHYTAQHSWEAAFGRNTGMELNMPIEDYTDELFDLVTDEAGKDRFVYAGGGDLQLPAIRGTGVYAGQTNPGVQSRSLASKTQSAGMDPASEKRIEFTEALRALATGQEAYAAHMPISEATRKQARMFEIQMGRQPTEEEMARLDELINTLNSRSRQNLPEGDQPWMIPYSGRAIPIDTEGGVRLMDVTGMTKTSQTRGDIQKSGFGDATGRIEDQIKAITGGGDLQPLEYQSIYGELDWAGGSATSDLLKIIDDPMYPNVRRLADSPQTRELMGDVAQMYKDLQAQGKLNPNQRLVDVLDAWSTGGLKEVRRLVDAGLAPAAVLGILGSWGFGADTPVPAGET